METSLRIGEPASQPVKRKMSNDLFVRKKCNPTFTLRSDLTFVILFLAPSILFVKAFFSDVSTSCK